MSRFNTLQELKPFLIIWFGQFVSLVGTSMTRFALIIWIYKQTNDAFNIALLGFFAYGAHVLLSPISGIIVDRFDRKKVLLLSDTGAGLLTMSLFILLATGQLQIWHLFVAQAVTGAMEAFQVPAYNAAITVMIPKQHYTRASGLLAFAYFGADVLAPFMAGVLLLIVGLQGIMLIDVITFFAALGTLALVTIPKPKQKAQDDELLNSRWQALTFGARYVFRRKGLLGLMFIWVGVSFFASLTYFSILPAMILARSEGDEIVLASVQSALGLSGVIGGFVLSIWGGPKRLIHSILLGTALSFILGDFLFAIGQTPLVWIIAASCTSFFIPFIDGAYRTIWQTKVEPALQGRVFAFRNMMTMLPRPFGFLLGGFLADRVFEPALMPDGVLSPILGGLVGTGQGAGMASMFLFTAIGGMVICLSGYLLPAIRNVEKDLPDYDETQGKP